MSPKHVPKRFLSDLLHALLSKPFLLWSCLFLTMILGMIAKALYDSRTNNERIELGWAFFWKLDVFLAIIVSPMVFGAIYGYLRDSPTNVTAFIFAFQNGFFWKTIFGRLEQPTAFPQ